MSFGPNRVGSRAVVRCLRTLCTVLPLSLALWGCDEDEKTKPPPPAPVLKLVGVRPALGASAFVKSGCVSLGPDRDRTVLVRVEVENYTLKPPGACRGATACGSVEVSFVGSEQFKATTSLTTAGVAFGDQPEGAYEVSVRLLDDQGKRLEPSPCAGSACKTSGAVRFVTSCDGQPAPSLDAGLKPDAAVEPPGPDAGPKGADASAPTDAAAAELRDAALDAAP